MGVDDFIRRGKAGNYAGRTAHNDALWVLDPSVTAHTRLPWFHGKPCKRCGSTVRYDRSRSRQCVRCEKQWRKENRKKWTKRKKAMRANPLYKSHNFDLARYDAIFTVQGGTCAICKQPETNGNRLCVDHCHRTGAFRGLLCNNCNRGVGLFKESTETLLSAANYLLENPWMC